MHQSFCGMTTLSSLRLSGVLAAVEKKLAAPKTDRRDALLALGRLLHDEPAARSGCPGPCPGLAS